MKLFLKYISILSVILISVAGYARFRTIRTQKRATTFQEGITRLVPGESAYAEVEQIIRVHSRDIKVGPSCNSQACSVKFMFLNGWPARMLLSPKTAFYGEIEVQGGKVHMISSTYVESNGALVHISERSCPCDPAAEPLSVRKGLDKDGRLVKRLVVLDTRLSTGERAKIIQLNLTCMSRWGGCTIPDRIAPGLPQSLN